MKFEANYNSQRLNSIDLMELSDLAMTATELYRLYLNLRTHELIVSTPKSQELFETFSQALLLDLETLQEHLVSRKVSSPAARVDQTPAGSGEHPYLQLPDVEPVVLSRSVFILVRRAFALEELFASQTANCLLGTVKRANLHLELRLKMIALGTAQRHTLLMERYGYVRGKSAILQGIKRQSRRLLGVLKGEVRNDIDR